MPIESNDRNHVVIIKKNEYENQNKIENKNADQPYDRQMVDKNKQTNKQKIYKNIWFRYLFDSICVDKFIRDIGIEIEKEKKQNKKSIDQNLPSNHWIFLNKFQNKKLNIQVHLCPAVSMFWKLFFFFKWRILFGWNNFNRFLHWSKKKNKIDVNNWVEFESWHVFFLVSSDY